MEKVFEGEITRGIINIPPGYTKTEMVVILTMARGLAVNPRAKFLHLSYADDLALENSLRARDTVQTEEFQALFPMKLRPDSKAKGRWYNEEGGGIQAAPAGGQVTGFRAGRMEPGFTGILLIDDPVKPDDAFSDTKRAKINDRFNTTIASRLARQDVPIVLIMQRIHDDDLTGFLLEGGSGEIWDHLEIPVEVDEAREYPEEYSHGRQYKHNLSPGPLWIAKHTRENIEVLRTNPKTSFTFSAQYDQRPAPPGGSIFRTSWFQYFDGVDLDTSEITDGKKRIKILYKMIFADTAQKTKESNDFSVFQQWVKGEDERIYLIDQERDRLEAPDLRKRFKSFCELGEFEHGRNQMGVRNRFVEDKSSGTGLIQDINREKGRDYIEGIPRDKDKVSRARSGAPHIQAGNVVLPRSAIWLPEYLAEFQKFSATMSHKFDDQIDATLDAIHKMLIEDDFFGYSRII
jgi:predicted phage terminase large subunit-like protein